MRRWLDPLVQLAGPVVLVVVVVGIGEVGDVRWFPDGEHLLATRRTRG